MKKGFILVAALLLLIAGNAYAGPNAGATVTIDYEADPAAANQTDDGRLSAIIAGDGTAFRVEIFVDPVSGPVIGGELIFSVDTTKAKVTSPVAPSPLFPFGNTANSATMGGVPGFAQLTVTNKYFGAVEWVTTSDVTGVEFTIAVTSISVIDAGSGAPVDTLLTTQVISFNATPKIDPPMSTEYTIPRGGEATTTLTVSNFAAGMVIEWSALSDNPDQLVTVVPAADGLSAVVTVSGPGGGNVTVTATDGTDTVTQALMFSEQVPAELSGFGGELVDGGVMLNWASVSQTNNAGWRVMRSVDGQQFEAISDIVEGAGTTDILLSYSFADELLPSVEQVFYLLEQIDLDGSIHRSNPIEVILGARFQDLPTEFSTLIYPNPFNPSTTVSYDLPGESLVSIVIYDALGQEVRRLVDEQKSAGRYSIVWDAKDFQGRSVGSGVYIAKVEAGTFSSSLKMLLLK